MYVTVICMRLRAFVDPAAPVGDLCAGSFWESIRLCVLIELVRWGGGCTLRRLLHGESFGKDFDFAHLLC
jgi:hypothetical protein